MTIKTATLMSVRAEWMQDDDDNGNGNTQALTIEMTHAGAGPYLVVETKRWAIDNPEELLEVLDGFSEQVKPLFERKPECTSIEH
jgi:hypothetical protein